MTTPAEAKKLTIAAVGASALFAAVHDLGNHELPRLRIAIGAVVAGAALALGAEWVPDLVGPFAALILVGALLSVGPPVIAGLTHALNTSGRQPTKKP
jgi:hypothetical protein